MLADYKRRVGAAHFDSAGDVALAQGEIAFCHSQFAEALTLASAAALTLKKQLRVVAALRAQKLQARAMMRLDRDEEAMTLLRDIIPRYARLTDDEGVIGQSLCYSALATLYRRRSQFAEGVEAGRKAVALARQKNGDRALAYALNALGSIHFAMSANLHPLATPATHMTSLPPSQDPTLLAHCKEAMQLLVEAVAIAERDKDEYTRAMLGANLAHFQVLLGHPLEALPAMQAFHQLMKRQRNTFMECDALTAMGWAYWTSGDYPRAEAVLTEALSLADGLNATHYFFYIHFDLSRTMEALGKVSQALFHYREYARLAHVRANKNARVVAVATVATAAPGGIGNLGAPYGGRVSTRLLEPYYIKRAEAFIRDRLPNAVSLEDVASHAGVSARTLQLGFKRYRDTTPNSFALRLRYEGAQGSLRDGSASTVAVAARRFGFDDAGAFSKEYRRRFGELPSHTLGVRSRG